ncbi:hypothetical protein CsSME_00014678 [Camellia sinensis var. sinensis]
MAKRRVVRALITKQASNSNAEVQTEQTTTGQTMETALTVNFKDRVVSTANSVTAEKHHLLAFGLSKSLYLPADMERHENLTELKAIRSATKPMVLTKEAELKVLKASLVELSAENEKLAKKVSAAEAKKQKALAEKKDRYLREHAKLEKKKDPEIKEL